MTAGRHNSGRWTGRNLPRSVTFALDAFQAASERNGAALMDGRNAENGAKGALCRAIADALNDSEAGRHDPL